MDRGPVDLELGLGLGLVLGVGVGVGSVLGLEALAKIYSRPVST